MSLMYISLLVHSIEQSTFFLFLPCPPTSDSYEPVIPRTLLRYSNKIVHSFNCHTRCIRCPCNPPVIAQPLLLHHAFLRSFLTPFEDLPHLLCRLARQLFCHYGIL
jgi:hypothetical protein